VGIVHARFKCCVLIEGQILVSNVMISTLCLDDDIFYFEIIIIIIIIIVVIVKRSNQLISSGLPSYLRHKYSEV
jgi:hypothetical protein